MDLSSKRKQIRDLVSEVLANVNDPAPEESRFEPEHLIVNSLRAAAEREFDRDESSKLLITEDDLRGLGHGSRLRVSNRAKFTPLAEDIIKDRSIVLLKKDVRVAKPLVRTVSIGADHGGYEMKEQLKPFLESLGIQVRDHGTNSSEAVDYPDFALAVGRSVAGGNVDIGILIDGAGIGSAMAANKVSGVRAAACYSEKLAINSREHNGANVLTLGSSVTTFDEAKGIIAAFVSSTISEDRHLRRVGKITSIENEFSK